MWSNPSNCRRARADSAGTRARLLPAALALLISSGGALSHEVSSAKADFVPPAPGTYRLERIQAVPDGEVVDTRNRSARLAKYTQGHITLLSLMYTSCADPSGCPMALYTLQKVRRDLEREKSTGSRVRIVSLSFDPKHDTPEVMRAYGAGEAQRHSPVPWVFLTARSPQDLRPVLDGLGQDVRVPADEAEAEKPANLTHMLKVFLIDRDGWVREIYTSNFLVPQVIVNDVQTLLLEDGVKLR
ncbi:MAG TPA: SCO family protein [Burkholderiales bacterium]|nr:SCO family protein [Burkholderiales bacterium]